VDRFRDNALRQHFKRLVKSGGLAHIDTGSYHLSKTLWLLKKGIQAR
jgi:hypothetical protein